MVFAKYLKHVTLAAGLLALSAGAGFAMQVDITVDKLAQRMHVVVDGEEKYTWLVSTGAPGHDTPSGHFHIFRFDKNHFSKEWDDAPMPNSMFFTALGHAIHGSSHVKALGTPASHGCVRLAPENAAILWDLVTQAGINNNSVTIKGGFFDKNLTTADTFKMSSDDLKYASAGGDDSFSQHPKGLFWWVKPQQQQAQDSQPSLFGAKKKTHSIFDLKKPDKKTATTDKKATDKKVADDSKPAPKKKKKVLLPTDKKPTVVGATEG